MEILALKQLISMLENKGIILPYMTSMFKLSMNSMGPELALLEASLLTG